MKTIEVTIKMKITTSDEFHPLDKDFIEAIENQINDKCQWELDTFQDSNDEDHEFEVGVSSVVSSIII
jgi:hypothetical protein